MSCILGALQYVVVCCSVLQCVAEQSLRRFMSCILGVLQCFCSALQCVAAQTLRRFVSCILGVL